jgi:hypothetical protein
VGKLEFEVSKASIAAATGIPNTGERWFKSMILNVAFSQDFLKPDYQTEPLCSRNLLSLSTLALHVLITLSKD